LTKPFSLLDDLILKVNLVALAIYCVKKILNITGWNVMLIDSYRTILVQ